MKTTILKVVGASLMVASTVQMAAATEQHMRRHRVPAAQQEQFRNSNAYNAAPNEFYAAPNYFAARPYGRLEAQDEAAMSSGIAGH
jgi:hypothetical protein